MSITCSICGVEINDGENKCSFCGTAVENTSATVEEKPAPAVEKTSAPVVETPAPTVEEVKPESVAAVPAAESKFVCSGCGKEYPNGGKFCAECGGKIEEKKPVVVQKEEAPKFVCSGCGKEYPAGTKFCAECGGKVEEVKPVAPVVFACTGCGKEYPAGTKFCSECGGKVAEKSAAQPVKKIVCTKCGKEYPDGGKFCAECGGKIEETIINNGNSFATANTKAAVKLDVNGLYDVVLQEVDDEEKAEVLLMLTEVMAISNQEAKKIVDTRYLFEGSVLVRENCSKEEAESFAKKIKFACFEKINIRVECNESSEKYLDRFDKYMTVEAARDMVEHGVDVNVKDNDGSTPLIKVVWHGHLDVVKYLVSQGADVNEAKNGWTPLHRAAARGHLDVVKYLVSQGADVNAKNNDGGTPFFMAAVHGHLDVVKYLVSQGADVNTEYNGGETLLFLPANKGFLDIVKYLVSQGADVNAEDNDGRTPLHWAAYNGELDIVKYLVSQGVDVNAEDDAGETPLDKAIEENEDEIADFLKQHGAVANFNHETTMTAAEKTPVEWIEKYFGNKIAELRTKSSLTAPVEYAYIATDTPFKYGLNRTNFTQCLQKLGIKYTNYDRCIMVFDNLGATLGSKTNGGIITLDGIWWSEMSGKVNGFEWKDVISITIKNGAWKGDFIEVNGQYVVLKAISLMGKFNFMKFLTAISGVQVVKGE